jgi:hypothetical protein
MKNIILFIIIGILMNACGIKPGDIDPLDEVKNNEFPRTYPTIMTEPPPYTPPKK